jgi:hypothetical protein
VWHTFIDDESEAEKEIEAEKSLIVLLKELKPLSGSPQRLTVSRDSIFEDSIAFFKNRNFNFTLPIKITFEHEPAIDGGGPVREYFTILLRKLLSGSSRICLFQGRKSHFLPSHNTDAVRSNLFKVAGRMVASSICHGGPCFPIFSQAVYSYYQNPNADDLSEFITEDDVVDIEIVEAISNVSFAGQLNLIGYQGHY